MNSTTPRTRRHPGLASFREAHIFQWNMRDQCQAGTEGIPIVHPTAPNHRVSFLDLCVLPFLWLFQVTISTWKSLRNEMERVEMGCMQIRTTQSMEITGSGENVFSVYLINTLPLWWIFLWGFLFWIVSNVIGLRDTSLKYILKGNLPLTIKFSCSVQLTSKSSKMLSPKCHLSLSSCVPGGDRHLKPTIKVT